MLTWVRELYVSRQHFTRAATGTIAPFAAFTFFVLFAYPGARRELSALIQAQNLIILVPAFFIVGYFAGMGVNAIANLFTRAAERLPRGIGDRFSYRRLYAQLETDIDRLYETYFQRGQFTAFTTLMGPSDKLDALREYLREYNHGGFSNIHHQFARVDVIRSFFVYGLILTLYESTIGTMRLDVTAVAAVAMLMSVLETPRRMRKVARAQGAFLVAASAIRDEQIAERGSKLERELETKRSEQSEASSSNLRFAVHAQASRPVCA